MLKHFFILMFVTFVMGLLSGVFVYFVSLPPIEPDVSVQPEEKFEIIVDMYGGCSTLGTCASYRILGSGSYTLAERDLEGNDTRFEGMLTDEQVRTLTHLLILTDLDQINDSEFLDICPTVYDGVAYRYEITYGRQYSIDSCVEDVHGEALFDGLNQYFEILKSMSS